ncbi:ubiquinol-cytochrome C reductase [Burkholderia pseudomallei]|nr:ubiquinol-cytochrome C reductase [Burkholderia pseudomallei]
MLAGLASECERARRPQRRIADCASSMKGRRRGARAAPARQA